MSDQDWPNLAAMFFNQVDRFGDRPFLWAKRQGAYKALSWGASAARVTPLARGLMALGVEPGERVGQLLTQVETWWFEQDFAPDRKACLAKLATLV